MLAIDNTCVETMKRNVYLRNDIDEERIVFRFGGKQRSRMLGSDDVAETDQTEMKYSCIMGFVFARIRVWSIGT
jgi:hypothetical protein